MRKYGKIDNNQKEIVSGLRKLGYSVFSLANVGNGFPDIIVGYNNQNYLFEIKDGSKSPSQRKLTEMEQKFFDNWIGQVDKVCNLDQILIIINQLKNH